MTATTVFTLCSMNYLAQARVLGDSLLRWNPGIRFVIGLVDRLETRRAGLIPGEWEVLEVEQLGIDSFDDMCRRYDILELNTAVKPFYFRHLLKSGRVERVIYLDPDIMVFDSLRPIEEALRNAFLVLTPHVLAPLPGEPPIGSFIVGGRRVSERAFLANGIYNLGFAAVARSSASIQCLDWWKERTRLSCLNRPGQGMYVDQLWMNLAPVFFDGVHVLRHPGCNVAYWNLHERSLTVTGESYRVNEVAPLIFFHFSAYDPRQPDRICRWFSELTLAHRPDLAPLFETYHKALLAAGHETLRNIPCALPLRRGAGEQQSGTVRAAFLSALDGSARLFPRAAKVQLGRLGRLCQRLSEA